MINIPLIAYPLSIIFFLVALALAGENTIISAEVLSKVSGASVLSSAFIAITSTAVEMLFASVVFRGDLTEVSTKLRKKPAATLSRLLFGGLLLGWIYHFDITTTYQHPQFKTDDLYFFGVVVASFVFGPELLMCVGWWLWNKTRDEETKLMANTNHKVAENEYRKAERQQLNAIARAAGKAEADKKAAARWGPQQYGRSAEI